MRLRGIKNIDSHSIQITLWRYLCGLMPFVLLPFHQLRTYLTFAKVFQPRDIDVINYYADTGEWHPATWFLYTEHCKLVRSEIERIKNYREKGDLL